MKRAVIYARVSTDEQSVNNQVEQLKTFIKLTNDKVTHVYKEKVSGGSANRPVFQQMLITPVLALDRSGAARS